MFELFGPLLCALSGATRGRIVPPSRSHAAGDGSGKPDVSQIISNNVSHLSRTTTPQDDGVSAAAIAPVTVLSRRRAGRGRGWRDAGGDVAGRDVVLQVGLDRL